MRACYQVIEKYIKYENKFNCVLKIFKVIENGFP